MGDWTPSSVVGSAVWTAGFDYDPAQQILFSRMDALQRKFGYAYAYDDAALGMSFVIDCEPFFFDYAGKHWMIELWKGQYGPEAGCEIGVYTRAIEAHPSPAYQLLDAALGPRPGDPVPSHNLFYDCAADEDRLTLQLTLYRNGVKVLERGPEVHWWLTGFKWGVFARPEELSVDIGVGLKDAAMRQAFEGALRATGYRYETSGNTVRFTFAAPVARQPRADSPDGAEGVLREDARVVDAYRRLGLPSNDPNHIPPEFMLAAGFGLLRAGDHYGRLAARLGADVAKAGAYVADVLARTFEVAAQQAIEWFNGALVDLTNWVLEVQRYLGLTMDYSCIVEVDNRAGSSDLLLAGASASEGAYAVAPPQWIPRGAVGRFVTHDTKLQASGSGGSVAYRYATRDLRAGTVTMSFSCPYGFWTRNAASVNGGPFRMQARTDGGWSDSPPDLGHPLSVRFIAVG